MLCAGCAHIRTSPVPGGHDTRAEACSTCHLDDTINGDEGITANASPIYLKFLFN